MQTETDRQRMLDMIEMEYEFVHRTIDDLSPETMLQPDVEGKWSIKDTLAHLTAWMLHLSAWLKAIAEGQEPERPREHFTSEQIDRINEEQYQRDKDLPLEDVLANFHNSYHELYALVQTLSAEELFVSTFGGLVKEPIWQWVKYNTYYHFYEHIHPVRKWLAENHKLGIE